MVWSPLLLPIKSSTIFSSLFLVSGVDFFLWKSHVENTWNIYVKLCFAANRGLDDLEVFFFLVRIWDVFFKKIITLKTCAIHGVKLSIATNQGLDDIRFFFSYSIHFFPPILIYWFFYSLDVKEVIRSSRLLATKNWMIFISLFSFLGYIQVFFFRWDIKYEKLSSLLLPIENWTISGSPFFLFPRHLEVCFYMDVNYVVPSFLLLPIKNRTMLAFLGFFLNIQVSFFPLSEYIEFFFFGVSHTLTWRYLLVVVLFSGYIEVFFWMLRFFFLGCGIRGVKLSFLDGYCSTVQGLLDWFEVDLGFTELSFIQIDVKYVVWSFLLVIVEKQIICSSGTQ